MPRPCSDCPAWPCFGLSQGAGLSVQGLVAAGSLAQTLSQAVEVGSAFCLQGPCVRTAFWSSPVA